VLRRTGLALVAAIAGLSAAVLLLPLAVQGMLHVLDVALNGIIWLATSLGGDADVWTVLTTVAYAAAGALLTRRMLALVGALVLVSTLALYGLQRLLGSEEEPLA
jgi:hypothetical protein